MHKTLILAAESMHVDQDVVECVKEVEVALTAQLCLAAKKIEKLKSELAILKGSNDEEIVFMHAEASRLKDIESKFESKAVNLQGTLSASENLNNELDKLQDAHTRLF
ncbi:hypothetical protein ACFXTH_013490 [Malus domestica]